MIAASRGIRVPPNNSLDTSSIMDEASNKYDKSHRLSLDSAATHQQPARSKADKKALDQLAKDFNNGLQLNQSHPAPQVRTMKQRLKTEAVTKPTLPGIPIKPHQDSPVPSVNMAKPLHKKDSRTRLLQEDYDTRPRSNSAPKIQPQPPKVVVSRDRSSSAQVESFTAKATKLTDRFHQMESTRTSGSLSVPESPQQSPPLPRMMRRLDSTLEDPDSDREAD